ncbi:unannotated protein [freshwater metagenome]|uniref:Unannotated protein n=1 Tax=freshwater metagenome TaxID=449393 RepID=A0A6J7UWX1_9ZZZZ
MRASLHLVDCPGGVISLARLLEPKNPRRIRRPLPGSATWGSLSIPRRRLLRILTGSTSFVPIGLSTATNFPMRSTGWSSRLTILQFNRLWERLQRLPVGQLRSSCHPRNAPPSCWTFRSLLAGLVRQRRLLCCNRFLLAVPLLECPPCTTRIKSATKMSAPATPSFCAKQETSSPKSLVPCLSFVRPAYPNGSFRGTAHHAPSR